jgi:hypothetical protein
MEGVALSLTKAVEEAVVEAAAEKELLALEITLCVAASVAVLHMLSCRVGDAAAESVALEVTTGESERADVWVAEPDPCADGTGWEDGLPVRVPARLPVGVEEKCELSVPSRLAEASVGV